MSPKKTPVRRRRRQQTERQEGPELEVSDSINEGAISDSQKPTVALLDNDVVAPEAQHGSDMVEFEVASNDKSSCKMKNDYHEDQDENNAWNIGTDSRATGQSSIDSRSRNSELLNRKPLLMTQDIRKVPGLIEHYDRLSRSQRLYRTNWPISYGRNSPAELPPKLTKSQSISDFTHPAWSPKQQRLFNQRRIRNTEILDIMTIISNSPFYVKMPGDLKSRIITGYSKKAYSFTPDESGLLSLRPIRISLPQSKAKIVYPMKVDGNNLEIKKESGDSSSPISISKIRAENSDCGGAKILQEKLNKTSISDQILQISSTKDRVVKTAQYFRLDDGRRENVKSLCGNEDQREDSNFKDSASANSKKRETPSDATKSVMSVPARKNYKNTRTSGNGNNRLSTFYSRHSLDLFDDEITASTTPIVKLPQASAYDSIDGLDLVVSQPPVSMLSPASPFQTASPTPLSIVPSGPDQMIVPIFNSVLIAAPQEFRGTPEVMHQPRPTKLVSVADIEPASSPGINIDGLPASRNGYRSRPRRSSASYRDSVIRDSSNSNAQYINGHVPSYFRSHSQQSQHFPGQPTFVAPPGSMDSMSPIAYLPSNMVVASGPMVPVATVTPPLAPTVSNSNTIGETNGMVYFYEPMQYFPQYFPDHTASTSANVAAPTTTLTIPQQPTSVVMPVGPPAFHTGRPQLDTTGMYYYPHASQVSGYY
ncbi:hypothetical protein V1511DRAFT_510115 [Dipodascopsis uninucleata]